MLAAGGAVEPFWKVYQQHYNSKLPIEMLNTYKIGTIDIIYYILYINSNSLDFSSITILILL